MLDWSVNSHGDTHGAEREYAGTTCAYSLTISRLKMVVNAKDSSYNQRMMQ